MRLMLTLIGCCCIAITTLAQAQRTFFLYLQTEDLQPFYVQKEGKNYSSTASGYLILPKMADSAVTIKVGFPGKLGEQEFKVALNGNDQGFVLRLMGEKGLGLVNLQTEEVVYQKKVLEALAEVKPSVTDMQPVKEPLPVDKPVVQINTAIDSSRVAKVGVSANSSDDLKRVNDSLAQAVAKREAELEKLNQLLEGNSKTTAASGTITASESKSAQQVKTGAVETTKGKQPAFLPMDFSMRAEADSGNVSKTITTVSDSAEISLIHIDTLYAKSGEEDTLAAERIDSAHMSIPGVVGLSASNVQADSTALGTTPAIVDTAIVTSSGEETNQSKQVNGSSVNGAVPVAATTVTSTPDSAAGKEQISLATQGEKLENETIERKPCAVMANASDVDSLATYYRYVIDLDDLVYTSRKTFKAKCFTTYQLRKLCTGVKSEVARYRILDAAYPYAADYFNFRELSDLFTQEYYINRFNAMLDQ